MFRLSTYGSCKGNPGSGGWGVQLIRPGGGESIFSGSAECTTSTQMEITAVVEGLRRVPEGEQVEVLTTNANVVGWLAHDWRRNNEALGPLLEAADALVAARRVRFALGRTAGARREAQRARQRGRKAAGVAGS